jgi:two-component system, cell cycle response regulator CtrA
MQIAIVSDDPAAVGFALSLREHGIRAERCANLEDAAEFAELYTLDLLLLDAGMSCATDRGISRFRSAHARTPMLVFGRQLTAEQSIGYFASGVDDIVGWPLRADLTAARIRAIVRRCRGADASVTTIGPLQFDMIHRSLRCNGEPIVLTSKEYELLELMLTRKGMVLTKDILLDQLYGGRDAPEDRIIDVFICKLRKKLMQHGVHNLIQTVRGLGYMLDERSCRVMPARPVAAPLSGDALQAA